MSGILAQLAHCLVLVWRDQAETLGLFESLRVAELDLWSPDSTQDMHPIVTISLLERLTRLQRATEFRLAFEKVQLCLVQKDLLQLLLFLVPVRLLLVCGPWLVPDLPWRKVDGTQGASIVGGNQRRLVVCALIADPLVASNLIGDAITMPVDRKLAVCTSDEALVISIGRLADETW